MQDIPVLAFSEKGTFNFNDFNQLPPGMKEWISETVLLNLELENDTILQKENYIRSRWGNYLQGTKRTKVLDPDECEEIFTGHTQDIYDECILSTHWHQDLPYNLNTPICSATSIHTPAGCVAVAMAQVMNYWQYPASFNWSILQNTYPYNSTSSSAYEVAWLMVDIGLKVNMNYNCESSGATSNKAKNVLDDDYGYSNSISHTNWNSNDIRNNIKWGYPLILGGYRTSTTVLGITWYTNGHAWVCDGLREEWDNYERSCPSPQGPVISHIIRDYNYYLHMNWGWGNWSNEDAWYFSNSLTRPDNGTGRDYKWNKDIIINIHP